MDDTLLIYPRKLKFPNYIFSNFSPKTGFDSSCKLSPLVESNLINLGHNGLGLSNLASLMMMCCISKVGHCVVKCDL